MNGYEEIVMAAIRTVAERGQQEALERDHGRFHTGFGIILNLVKAYENQEPIEDVDMGEEHGN